MCQHRMSTTEIPLGRNAVSLDMVALTVLLKCTLAFLNDMIAISPSHISDVGSFRQMTHGSTVLIPAVRRTPFTRRSSVPLEFQEATQFCLTPLFNIRSVVNNLGQIVFLAVKI